MSVKCAECQCAPPDCHSSSLAESCNNCTKEVCCCTYIHPVTPIKQKNKKQRPSSSFAKLQVVDDCCSTGTCRDNATITKDCEAKRLPLPFPKLAQFFKNVKSMYATALGIEMLCIAAAETGENTGLYILGFNHIGIPLAYAIGYALSTFTTFATILGRYEYGDSSKNNDNNNNNKRKYLKTNEENIDK